MDKVTINKIKEILGHFVFQYTIIDKEVNRLEKQHEIKPELLKFLISQNKKEKEIIELLGGKFPDTGIIKNLNETIRELENKNVEKGELSFENIIKYIEIKQKEITQNLKENYGLKAFIKISCGTVVEVTMNNIQACLPATGKDLRYVSSDKEKESLELKMKEQHEIAKKYFSFKEDGEIIFNDRNYNTLVDIINKEFSNLGQINNLKTINRHLRDQNNTHRELFISGASLNIIVLKSHLTLNEQLKHT